MNKIINWLTEFLKTSTDKSSRRLAFISNAALLALMVFVAFIYFLTKQQYSWMSDLLQSYGWYVLALGGFVVVDTFKKKNGKND